MIGIVMLNYNGWKMTMDCVSSIRESCHKPFTVYIVDNASTVSMPMDFRDFIESSKDCVFFQNEDNKGYSAGNNIGIKCALENGCEYIMITNNDVIFKPQSIEKLCEYLDEHPDYGIAGPKVYTPNGDIQEINYGCKMTLSGKYKYILRKTPLKFLTKKFIEEFHVEKKDLAKPFDVYAVSGCCFVMSRKTANLLYPMDEHTFLYEEENIVGARMERLGLKTVYNTDSEIIHLGGGSTEGKMSAFAYRCFMKSEMYYCLKYLGSNKIKIFPLFMIRSLAYIKIYLIDNVAERLKGKTQ